MRKCLIVGLLVACIQMAYAQSHSLHPVFIYSFTRYVVWPDDYNKGDFEILVLGESPIIEGLQQLAAKKKVGDRNIKVTKINSPGDIRKCNMLYVPLAQSSQIEAVLNKTNAQSILVITEEPGLGVKGSDINFITKDGKLVFELNQAAAGKHNLKVSNNLLAMAILI